MRRADGRDLDYWLVVNPSGTEKGALMVFNPTDKEITREIEVPLYYTGLEDRAVVFQDSGLAEELPLSRYYAVTLTVTLEAQGWSTWFIK